MRSPRPFSSYGFRGAAGAVALAVVLVAAGCSSAEEAGPSRLTPNPNYDAAEAMIKNGPVEQKRLNACELLALTVDEVIDLTDATMPDVEPTGSGDLGLICTYGGPGSPERAEAEAKKKDDDDGDASASATSTTTDSTSTEATSSATPTTTTTESTSTESGRKDRDSGRVPDTFAAGVVTPIGEVGAALAGQQTLLGSRYACSEIRGAKADTVQGAPAAAPGSPPPTQPSLDTAYIDCLSSPTGGGVEAHTILISGDYLWHITLLEPEVPRSEKNDVAAIAGLHRVAEHILG